MTFYIDESGNTGGASVKDSKFNFLEQPYYALAGIVVRDDQKSAFELFIHSQKSKHKVFAPELKAKSIYDSKPAFINELIDYIIDNRIPTIIELMDKKYYLNTQLINYFFMPFHFYPIDNDTMATRIVMASNLSSILDDSIYASFLTAVQSYSNESLELFYETLISYFSDNDMESPLEAIQEIKADYFEDKEKNPAKALESHLPLPDKNSNDKLIHLLPNYSAFSNIIARVQKFKSESNIHLMSIVHDEQKQFDKIFKEIIDTMKTMDSDSIVEGTFVGDRAIFNIEKEIEVIFSDSKNSQFIQIADLLAGFIMRVWNDFSSNNLSRLDRYKASAKKLIFISDEPLGVNFVVPHHLIHQFMQLIHS